MDYNLGKHAFETGANYVNNRLENVNYGKIRTYFDITNIYALNKLWLIICPFAYKEFSIDGPGLYKPDLYIPLMSLITSVLFNGFLLGLKNKFHPEHLYLSLTRTICIHCILNLIYKFIGYLFDIDIAYGDMLSYTGYKFFVVLLIKILKLTYIGKIVSIYLYVAFFFFLSRSLKSSFLKGNSSKKRLYALFGTVIIDVILTFFLSY